MISGYEHLQRLSPHGLHWPTVDEGLDTAALTSVSLMLRRSASVNHVVTSVASAVSNCNTHKCPIARRQERSIRYFAMSIAKRLMWFTSLTVTSAGRNT